MCPGLKAPIGLVSTAAWSGSPVDAATALLHAQAAILPVAFDMHQFNGALGFTLEHSLHSWTQRLRWLDAEMGGPIAAGQAAADLAWPDPRRTRARWMP